MSTRPDPGPFRWFFANRVTKPCPDCGHPTSVGFDRADPGAGAREPTRCVQCTTAQVDNAIQFARGELGYPLTEQGPCVSCGGPTRRYGPHSRPECESCAQLEPEAKAAAEAGSERAPEPRSELLTQVPEPRLAPERQPAGHLQPRPPDLEVQPELDLELSA